MKKILYSICILLLSALNAQADKVYQGNFEAAGTLRANSFILNNDAGTSTPAAGTGNVFVTGDDIYFEGTSTGITSLTASATGTGTSVLIDGTSVSDGSGVDIQGGADITITFNAGASPDTASIAADDSWLKNDANDTMAGTLTVTGDIVTQDDQGVVFGSGTDTKIVWETTGNDNLQIGTRQAAGGAGCVSIMPINDMGHANRSPINNSVSPRLRVYSYDETQPLDYIQIYHDDTNALLLWGQGELQMGTSTVLCRLLENGNMGIGVTSPQAKLAVEGTLMLKEQADADADAAAYGQIWVNTATPNELWFTDDAGTDVQLGIGGDLVTDLTPQLGGDLDLNAKNIDFPTTANISDVLDEDTMVSNSATMLATQQSIKAYADSVAAAGSGWTDSAPHITATDATDNVSIGTGTANAKLDVQGSVLINDDSADVDVRIEGGTDTNLLKIDAGLDRIGVGTGTPQAKLDVEGTIRAKVFETELDVGSTGYHRFVEDPANGSNYVALNAPSSIAANVEWTLPSADAAGVLKSDGSLTLSLATADGDDINSNIAGRSLTLTAASPDTLDADAELYTDTKGIYIEDPVAADDLKSIWRNGSGGTYTMTEIWAECDAGTVTFMLQIDDGTPADIDSVDLAPAAGTAEDTSLNGDVAFDPDARLDIDMVSVVGTPTWISIQWTYTKDD